MHAFRFFRIITTHVLLANSGRSLAGHKKSGAGSGTDGEGDPDPAPSVHQPSGFKESECPITWGVS